MAEAWSDYQEEVAAFFRALGLDAETNVSLKGVHTEHDVDVVVKSRQAGFEVTWIVECKLWRTRVTKNHVLALRTIVSDLGADRGILLAENGFQSGAIEAAALTNVHVSSLAEVFRTSRDEFAALKLIELDERVSLAKERYWNIPKSIRIEHLLRPEFNEHKFFGDQLIAFAEEMLGKGHRAVYPIEVSHLYRAVLPECPTVIDTPQEVVSMLDPLVSELERRLGLAEASMAARP